MEIEEFGSIVQNYCLCDPVKYIIVYIKISKGGKFLNISARRTLRDEDVLFSKFYFPVSGEDTESQRDLKTCLRSISLLVATLLLKVWSLVMKLTATRLR